MRALLIEVLADRRAISVREVDVPGRPGSDEPDYDRMSDLVGGGFLERVPGPNVPALLGHGLYVDEEGLGKPQEAYTHCPALHEDPLAGKILVMGEKDTEDGLVACAASISIMTLYDLVRDGYCDRDRAQDLLNRSTLAAKTALAGFEGAFVVDVELPPAAPAPAA